METASQASSRLQQQDTNHPAPMAGSGNAGGGFRLQAGQGSGFDPSRLLTGLTGTPTSVLPDTTLPYRTTSLPSANLPQPTRVTQSGFRQPMSASKLMDVQQPDSLALDTSVLQRSSNRRKHAVIDRAMHFAASNNNSRADPSSELDYILSGFPHFPGYLPPLPRMTVPDINARAFGNRAPTSLRLDHLGVPTFNLSPLSSTQHRDGAGQTNRTWTDPQMPSGAVASTSQGAGGGGPQQQTRTRSPLMPTASEPSELDEADTGERTEQLNGTTQTQSSPETTSPLDLLTEIEGYLRRNSLPLDMCRGLSRQLPASETGVTSRWTFPGTPGPSDPGPRQRIDLGSGQRAESMGAAETDRTIRRPSQQAFPSAGSGLRAESMAAMETGDEMRRPNQQASPSTRSGQRAQSMASTETGHTIRRPSQQTFPSTGSGRRPESMASMETGHVRRPSQQASPAQGVGPGRIAEQRPQKSGESGTERLRLRRELLDSGFESPTRKTPARISPRKESNRSAILEHSPEGTQDFEAGSSPLQVASLSSWLSRDGLSEDHHSAVDGDPTASPARTVSQQAISLTLENSSNPADTKPATSRKASNAQPPSQTKKEKIAKGTDKGPIQVRVMGQDGSTVSFKIGLHTPLIKLMKGYCIRMNHNYEVVQFRVEGVRIKENDTCAILGIKDHGIIDMFFDQSGGGSSRPTSGSD